MIAAVPDLARPIFLGKFTPGSDEWQAARAERIGGSDIAAIMTLSPFESYFSTYWRKKGVLAPVPENEAMEWGNRLEPAVLAKFVDRLHDKDNSDDSDWHLRGRWMINLTPGSYVRDDRLWQLATPDAILSVDGMWDVIIEAKTSRDDIGWGPDGSSIIPVGYRCQVLWNLNVFGLRRAIIPVLISGSTYREYVIDLDADPDAAADLELMLAAGADFIEALRTDDEPQPNDGSEATYEAVRDLHPDIEAGETAEFDEIDKLMPGEYLDALMELEAATERFQTARSQVLHAMGRAQHARLDGVRFASRSAKTLANGQKGKPFLLTDRATKKRLTAKTISEATKEETS